MIVELHLNHGKPINSLAKEYGVSASSISRWVIFYRNKRLSETEKLSKGVPFDSFCYAFRIPRNTYIFNEDGS